MSTPLRDRLGALAERDFRLLFTGTAITTAGDQVAGIALAFAVLDLGSATDLGIVFSSSAESSPTGCRATSSSSAPLSPRG